MTTILETSLIPPQSSQEHEEEEEESAAELKVPLTFFDIPWILFPHPIRRLLFFRQPPSCSKPMFLNTIVPKLKESLSLTLKHYLPVAGNMLYPLNRDDDEAAAQKPFIRYKNGDSIPFTVAESDEDFDELVANHPRDADRFHAFIPQMPPFGEEQTLYKTTPLMALQVTLFPGRGLCIGFSNNHCLGDANSIVRFIKAWASISKGETDDDVTSSKLIIPLFDRSVVKDPLGIDNIFWGVIKQLPLNQSSSLLPTNRFRATFVLDQSHIKKLKQYVLAKKPDAAHVSSFVVAASYTWTCFVKSSESVGEKAPDQNMEEIFGFAVDVRSRVDPPIPDNYFGNCLGTGMASLKHGDLVGEQGLLLAAESISDDIKNRVNNKDEVLRGAENWLSDWMKIIGKSLLSVSGSPKFDLYEVDFGFGRAEKLEVLSIDGENYSMSLCKSRDSEGGIEIGFSLPKERLEAFGAIFEDELKKIDDALNC